MINILQSLVVALGAATITTAAGTSCSSGTSLNASQPNILETAREEGSFKTLLAAVEAAGLSNALSGDGPFTVFAPTDAAFAKLPEGTVESLLLPENAWKLNAILTYHVVPGRVMALEVVTLDSAPTLFGQNIPVQVNGGSVKAGGANVTATDINTSNGVIHVIDSVMLPADIVGVASSAGGFATLLAAAGAAGLADTLASGGPFTVFAPTDEAFAKLPAGTLDSLLKPENRDQLVSILKYHVVPGRVLAADVTGLTSATTIGGQSLPIQVSGGSVHVGGAGVTATDIMALNGVIHVIDSVMLP